MASDLAAVQADLAAIKKQPVPYVTLRAVAKAEGEKQTVDVRIKNAYVEGLGAVMYTACEVYATMGVNTDVCTLLLCVL